jgi:hypothetical protein
MYKSSCISNPHSQASPLEGFAHRYRLRITLDGCRDQIISGKHGNIADHGDGENLMVAFWGTSQNFSRLRAGRIKRTLEESHGQHYAGGGDEALIVFSPKDERAALFFLQALAIRRKRRVSVDIIERLRSFRRPAGTALHASEAAVVTGGVK